MTRDTSVFGVQSIFGVVPVAKFVEEYMHRLPFALAGSAGRLCTLGAWDAVGAVLAGAANDTFATRAGEWYGGESPASAEAARRLLDDGYTVFVRHAERHHPVLAEVARSFEHTFQGPVNIHWFATPAGWPGFSWHYDAEDVFIIQTAGEKEYSLRKNTVNPWPLEETLPQDMRYEREQMPLMRVLLRPGDLLYIPCGYWHKAEAKGLGPGGWGPGDHESPSPRSLAPGPQENAISLAVGVMSRSAMDVYDFLRKRLVESLVWRQRLPLAGPASGMSRDELESIYGQIFGQLKNDISRTLADSRLVADFLDELTQMPPQQPTADRDER